MDSTVTVKQFLKDNMGSMEAHRRISHSKGCCWDGEGHSYAMDREAYVNSIRLILESGELNESSLAQLGIDVAEALRLIVYNSESKEQRLKVIEEAQAEYEAEKNASGKAFARTQIDKLVEMGFSQGCAYRIMKVAGPGRCVKAVEWAQYAFHEIDSVDALDCLLSGAGGTNKFGADRMEAALRAFGLEPPSVSSSTGLFAVLRGAKEVLLVGLPGREPAEA